MAGYTDAPFRRLCTRFGADYVVSEMISATALVMRDRKTASLARITPGEAPVILQIFGHEPDTLAEAARLLLSGDYPGCSYAAPPAGIDLNMGCPVKKIVSNGDGCALMLDEALAARCVSAVRRITESFGVPLSVKCRIGWDDEHRNAAGFCLALAEAGADQITLHCRTKAQLYAPGADYTAAAEAVSALRAAGFGEDRLSFIGNGDVDSPEAANALFAAGCDGVAIGRAALGAPWIFSVLKDPGFRVPNRAAILDLVTEFVTDVAAEKGEVVGIRESRGRAAFFLRGFRGAARVRDRLNHAETLGAFTAILSELYAENAD